MNILGKLHLTDRTSATVIAGALLVIVTMLTQIPNSPSFRCLPYRDSGVFLYVGQQILQGQVPYRDIWDHKPPLVFYINAIGLLISDGSIWGVWWVEVVMLSVATVLGFALMRSAFGLLPSILASVLWILSLQYVQEGGNLTEEYCLPLQFGALYLYWRSWQRWQSVPWLWCTLLGAMGALAFLLRQNLVGVWIILALHCLLSAVFRQARLLRLIGIIVSYACGTVLILTAVAAYFQRNDAWTAFWSASFEYSFVYSSPRLVSLLVAAETGVTSLSKSGIVLLAASAWFAAMFWLLRGGHQLPKARVLYQILVPLFPIEMLLTSISGRAYGHYFMAWLPVLAILAASLFGSLGTQHVDTPTRPDGSPQLTRLPWSIIICVSCILLPTYDLLKGLIFTPNESAREEQTCAAVQSVREATETSDYVLLWGAEAGVNFAIERRSPSRFVYQYPLFHQGYGNAHIILQFLQDLQEKRPRLIIDTLDPALPPIGAARRAMWKPAAFPFDVVPPGIYEVLKFIETEYEFERTIMVNNRQWDIYVHQQLERRAP